MLVPWLWAALCVAQCACGGASLQGAVEALQRRQRGHRAAPLPEYDALYEFVPPGYSEPDYVDYLDEEPSKYIVKLLDENERPRTPDAYEYKVVKKDKNVDSDATKKESAFRERSHQNDRLKDLFTENSKPEEKKPISKARAEDEAEFEYALLLNQLWHKYKHNKEHAEPMPQGVVKLYKEKVVKKRYPDNWGPIAFKRKRSSGSDIDRPAPQDYEPKRQPIQDPNYSTYDISDNDKDDWREEYAIAFQPLEDDSISELGDRDRYTIDSIEKRFPVSKRSSGPYYQKKRLVQDRSDKTKSFRSSSGTDPRIIKDLSKIFGDDVEIVKVPVKRDTAHESHETKPPKVTMLSHNDTHEHSNHSRYEVESHEQHQGHMHHPGHEGMKEVENIGTITDDLKHGNHEKPITVKKKSIDWSDYFGIDKRAKKFVNNGKQDDLRKQYFDTFNKEVIYPLNSFRRHHYVKRNYRQAKPDEEIESHVARAPQNEEGKHDQKDKDSELDTMDKNLRDMEGMLVDEALHYSDLDEELDSKEEQEMKDQLLSQLAAAYSLEKMRKALKEFKQELQMQRSASHSAPAPTDEIKKVKRVAVKKELKNNMIPAFNKQTGQIEEFEEDQGAGHYLNGREQKFSEGYMGSGRHRSPVIPTVGAPSACPVLTKIVQRCHGVDILAGDRGQLFLPLCSLHQICYLCGEAPQTTCDLLFLSEADTSCEGDMNCQQAARAALMALRDLHDNLADELDGECDASPCLPQTLRLNVGWQRAFQR